jgi:hypothetical protein
MQTQTIKRLSVSQAEQAREFLARHHHVSWVIPPFPLTGGPTQMGLNIVRPVTEIPEIASDRVNLLLAAGFVHDHAIIIDDPVVVEESKPEEKKAPGRDSKTASGDILPAVATGLAVGVLTMAVWMGSALIWGLLHDPQLVLVYPDGSYLLAMKWND